MSSLQRPGVCPQIQPVIRFESEDALNPAFFDKSPINPNLSHILSYDRHPKAPYPVNASVLIAEYSKPISSHFIS